MVTTRGRIGTTVNMTGRLYHLHDEARVPMMLEAPPSGHIDFDGDRCVVVHGDAAAANALRVLAPRAGAENGFVFVDPDGFVGDAAYDVGVALRDWCPQLLASNHPSRLARHYSEVLARHSGLDAEAIWERGFLERVSTGLYALGMGANDLSEPYFTSAEALA